MAQTDPIADFLTRIRNAQRAKHQTVSTNFTKINYELARILKEEGYISSFETKNDGTFPTLEVALKYNETMDPMIREIKRLSKPGCRRYANVEKLHTLKNPFATLILSTSKGVMTDGQAFEHAVGGELLCRVS
ncbi:MAG: 30S ribosomal protein S8 [Bdellovibrionota bacterium]